MVNFNLKPYEWQKHMDIVLENVNLIKIEILNDRSILFSFLNSYDGKFYKKILCLNVWKFISENNCENGDELPFFICDVRKLKLVNGDVEATFDFLKYGFNIPISNEYNLLCMNSGEIGIYLICETIEISEIPMIS